MPRLLITGASGFLGWSLCQAARSSWQVFGTYQTRLIQIPGCTLLKVDLREESSLRDLMATVQPHAVIHAAALSSPNVCQANPELSFAVNVSATMLIADYCAAENLPCVFTSTDQVFAGTSAPYRESDAVSPVNLYGEHKVLAEQGLRERHGQAVICRLPLMYGAVPHADSFIQPWMRTLRAGGTLQLFVDETRTPTSSDDVAKGLLLALQHLPPYLHLGGPEILTRFEMGQILSQLLYISGQISPCAQADVAMPAPRPSNVALDSSLAQSLGFRPQPFQSELKRILQLDDGNC